MSLSPFARLLAGIIPASPFARLLAGIIPASPSRRHAAASTTPVARVRETGPRRTARAAKTASETTHLFGATGAARRLGPATFLHLNTAASAATKPPPDDTARACAILALPEAREHPVAAARLAADPGASVAAARQVLRTIPAAVAREANAKAHPFVAQMLAVRSLVDGQAHAAVQRGPELAQHDRANAAAARRQRAEDIRTGAIAG